MIEALKDLYCIVDKMKRDLPPIYAALLENWALDHILDVHAQIAVSCDLAISMGEERMKRYHGYVCEQVVKEVGIEAAKGAAVLQMRPAAADPWKMEQIYEATLYVVK